MDSLTNDELDLLYDLIMERWDDEKHYPDTYTEEEMAASSSLYDRAHSEAKKRKLIWAR